MQRTRPEDKFCNVCFRANEEETVIAKKLQGSQGPEPETMPEERGGKGLPGPDLPSDADYGGVFTA